jgi:hypothetical protein
MLRILLGVLLGGCAALTTTGTLAVAEADEPAPQVGSMCPADLAEAAAKWAAPILVTP